MERRLARIHPVASYEDIADCDVVIEAVFEQMDVKKPVFDEARRGDEAGTRCCSPTPRRWTSTNSPR